MLQDSLIVVAGLALLFAGGEALVRGAVALAERLGISRLLIGLVIVGFGTSTPELLVSVRAALAGAPEIALGNVVGSNIANILLITGLAVLMAPIAGWQRSAVREALVMTLVALVAVALVTGDRIGRPEGFAMLAVLVGYLSSTVWLERRAARVSAFEEEAEAFEGLPPARPWLPVVFTIGGIVALVFGADLLVKGAVNIARAFAVPDAVIGLSLVAVGTSLPELATAIVAALRRQSDVVLGNVIGSNIFNVLAILGVTVTIRPIAVDPRFQAIDAPVMLAASLALLVLLFAATRIGRLPGALMLTAYGGYMVFLFWGGMGT